VNADVATVRRGPSVLTAKKCDLNRAPAWMNRGLAQRTSPELSRNQERTYTESIPF
jgi:hypothetical protein